MQVSVIIPNYNHEKYLDQRINSILNQTYKTFEIIILDDSSTDNSTSIINRYANHEKVSNVLFNSTNGGSVFKQWKKGIELAKGEYIWIAESDDFAHPEFLEKLVPILENDTTLGLVYCDSAIVDGNGNIDSKTYAAYRKYWLSSSKWESSYIKDGREEIEENLLRMCTINNASAVLFRKEAIKKAEPFDLPLKYIGDWYCYLKICMQFKIAFTKDVLNYYREHESNSFKKSRKNLSYVNDYFLVFDWIFKNLDFIEKSVILKYFKGHTRQSLIRNWNLERISTLKKLCTVNPYLFFEMILHNIKAPFHKADN